MKKISLKIRIHVTEIKIKVYSLIGSLCAAVEAFLWRD